MTHNPTKSNALRPGITPSDASAIQPKRYPKRDLSYASTFDGFWQPKAIRTIEWLTGKASLLRMVRRFERLDPPHGQAFWRMAFEVMGITLTTPEEEVQRIPRDGPLVIVANHPHGLVDGMVLAELIGRVRRDYKILTRNLLTGVEEVAQFMIPVPFQHAPDARERNLEMRKAAMDHLLDGGAIVLFPAGVVASAKQWFGPAIEQDWNPFTAKLIQRSGARVIPICFPGQNSRAYQIANLLSPVLRQGLLLHEVVHSCHRPQRPIVGDVMEREEIAGWASNPRGFVAQLRERTLSLATKA